MTTQAQELGTTLQQSTLDNGMRVVTGAMPHARSVAVCAFVGVGSRYEPADRAGVSHIIEHLVFKGTDRRQTPPEISGALEGVGGEVNAGTEQELTVYWCKVARPYLEESLDLLVDQLRNSLYRPDDIEKERLVVMEEQRMINDHPGHKLDVLVDEMLWPDHPLGRDISGTSESLAGITRDVILDHVSQFYTPSNIVFSVAGNVDHGQVVSLLDSHSRGWSSKTPPGWTPFVDGQTAPQVRLKYRRTEQAQLSIGVPGLSVAHPDRHALDLLSVVLGEGMSSRLFLEVREKRGLAYDIHSGVTSFRDCGAFVTTAGVDPKRVYPAVETILAEIGRLREGMPEEELERAKRLSTGMLMLRMEDTKAVASWTGAQELLQGRVLDVDEVVDAVGRVTTDDVRRVAGDLLKTEKLNLALVGPRRGERRLQGLLRL